MNENFMAYEDVLCLKRNQNRYDTRFNQCVLVLAQESNKINGKSGQILGGVWFNNEERCPDASDRIRLNCHGHCK
jgi:hypothetical protein